MRQPAPPPLCPSSPPRPRTPSPQAASSVRLREPGPSCHPSPPLRPSVKSRQGNEGKGGTFYSHKKRHLEKINRPRPLLSSPHSSLLRTVPSLSRRGLRKSTPCLPGSPGSFSVLPGASSLQLSAEAAAPISAPSASATVPLQRRKGRPGTTSPPKGAEGPPLPPSPAAGVLLLPASALPAAEPAAPLLLLKIGSSSILPVPLRLSQTFLG